MRLDASYYISHPRVAKTPLGNYLHFAFGTSIIAETGTRARTGRINRAYALGRAQALDVLQTIRVKARDKKAQTFFHLYNATEYSFRLYTRLAR